MTSPDIPTPETDAEQRQFGIGENRMYISADFARDLERRLAAATARAEEAETRLFDQVEALRSMTGATETETPMFKARALLSELDRLRKEVERLREDAKRLDWLDGMNKDTTFGIYPDARDGNWSIIGNPTDSYSGGIHLGDGDTLRAAIDAAMSLPTAPKQEEGV